MCSSQKTSTYYRLRKLFREGGHYLGEETISVPTYLDSSNLSRYQLAFLHIESAFMMITNQDCRAKGTSKLAFRRISAHALMDFFFYADFAMKVKFRSKTDSIIVQFKFKIVA